MSQRSAGRASTCKYRNSEYQKQFVHVVFKVSISPMVLENNCPCGSQYFLPDGTMKIYAICHW